jgi:N-acetyl-gamma-glutamyl-phosphate reductase
MDKIKAIVCGATGYSGMELLRLLSRHRYIEVVGVTSESSAGKTVGEITPSLVEYSNLVYSSIGEHSIYEGADIAFLCLPHEPAAVCAKHFLDGGTKVIDLSAAYRIKDLAVFQDVYRFTHPHPELVDNAVYGLCELYRDKIKEASLVANPGCYPTSALLPLLPLYANGIISNDEVIIDSKSGFSGRGKKIDLDGLFVEMNENFYAYNIGKHRHRPEITQELSRFADKNIKAVFTPHVIPLDRGILSTIYLDMDESGINKTLDFLSDFYKNEKFVKVMKDRLPQIKWVSYTNNVLIGAEYDYECGKLVIVSVIDNLVKGASGQALQNCNIMFGFEEAEGLI